ncbi:hypothetical protein WN944_029419 [Citrus x changshan-huyou]|uniref:Dirigent protein n=1 Tax=Citrus x changshan-huyou TaxID=2935761 RepID=A0AAP0LL63_9ROSI
MSMSFVFINGPNNGCCISLLGNNKLMSPIREMPIDGNIGIFRFGGGYAIAQAHWMDLKFGDAIVGYNAPRSRSATTTPVRSRSVTTTLVRSRTVSNDLPGYDLGSICT